MVTQDMVILIRSDKESWPPKTQPHRTQLYSRRVTKGLIKGLREP